jgi:hypothetical protein
MRRGESLGVKSWLGLFGGLPGRGWAQGAGMPGAGGPGGVEIRDVLPPVEISYWSGPMVAAWVGLGALGLGLLGVYGWRLWKKTRPVQPPPSPMELALAALRRLRQQPIAELKARDFAAEVALILRRFLEARLGLQVTRQTTDEFLASLESSPGMAGVDRDRLRVFLEQCDRCKFAGVDAAAEAREALIAAAEAQVIGGKGGA